MDDPLAWQPYRYALSIIRKQSRRLSRTLMPDSRDPLGSIGEASMRINEHDPHGLPYESVQVLRLDAIESRLGVRLRDRLR